MTPQEITPQNQEPVTAPQEQASEHFNNVAPAPMHEPKKPKFKFVKRLFAGKNKFISIGVIIIVVVGSGAGYWQLNKAKPSSSSSKSTTTTKAALPTATNISGNTYLDSPKLLTNLGIYKNTDYYGQTCDKYDQTTQTSSECHNSIATTDIKYYQIGTTKNGAKIIVSVTAISIYPQYEYFIGNNNGTYELLLQNTQNVAQNKDEYVKGLASNASINSTDKLSDITFPAAVTIETQGIKSDYTGIESASLLTDGISGLGSTASSEPEKIGTSGDFDFYEIKGKSGANYETITIYGVYKHLFAIYYSVTGELFNSSGPSISWTSGAGNYSTYITRSQGCGAGDYVKVTGISDADLKNVGKTGNSQAVYQLPTTNALVDLLYNDDYLSNQDLIEDENLRNLTIYEFANQHAYFVTKNGLNEYVLFLRDDMFIRGGCGKPVVYLYPQTTTNVSVKVGAQVKISEPTYTSDGWQNVTAKPSGQLTYQGKQYSSLYWEGYGNGVYPEINSGAIVKTSDAIATIKSQLAMQGFNQKEISDFLDFWAPKVNSVTKPYIRLTWLDTAQMNKLAPLEITPKPNTVIRTFLDFEGLDQKTNLPTQKLSSVKRNGFTVTEWGGLLRQGIR